MARGQENNSSQQFLEGNDFIQFDLHRVVPHQLADYKIPQVEDPALTRFYGKIKSSKYADLIVPLHQEVVFDDRGHLGRGLGQLDGQDPTLHKKPLPSVVDLIESGVGLE